MLILKNDNIQKSIEVKILLNFLDVFDENTDYNVVKNFNSNFINKVIANKKLFKNYEISNMFPIVSFSFDSINQRDDFIESVKNYEEVLKVDILDNNYYVENSNDKPKENINIKRFEEANHINDFYEYLNISDYYKNENPNEITKIGILEAGKNNIPPKYYDDFSKKGIVVKDNTTNTNTDHGYIVSSIIGGKNGIDKSAKIYYASFSDALEDTNKDNKILGTGWYKAIEWFIQNNVKIINHSYGPAYREIEGQESNYLELNFILDYISKRHGIINVFSSGNGNDDDDEADHITRYKASYNNIVVGALDYDYTNLKNIDRIASYSNFKLNNWSNNLAKPNIVAPGYILKWNKYDGIEIGTSYAAPIITALSSILLRKKPNINNDDFRIQAVRAILAASSRWPKNIELEKKNNGFDKKYGAGVVDFQNMLLAADNIVLKTVENNDNEVYISETFKIKKDENLRASISWLFSGGILNDYEISPKFGGGDFDFEKNDDTEKPFINGWNVKKLTDEWNKSHESHLNLKFEETKKRTNNKLINDYDLFLEKRNSSWDFETVASSNASNSTDELIDYNSSEDGIYRLRIENYSKTNNIKNLAKDKIALSYLIRGNNE